MIYTVPFEEQQIRWVKYNANVDADSKYEAFEKVQNIIENGESPTQQADIECNFEKLGDYLDTLKVDISDYSVGDVKEISSNVRENWNAGSQEKFYVDEDFTGGVLPNNIVYLQAKDELGLGILVYYHAPFEKKEDAFELLADLSRGAIPLPDYRKHGNDEQVQYWTNDIEAIYENYFPEFTQNTNNEEAVEQEQKTDKVTVINSGTGVFYYNYGDNNFYFLTSNLDNEDKWVRLNNPDKEEQLRDAFGWREIDDSRKESLLEHIAQNKRFEDMFGITKERYDEISENRDLKIFAMGILSDVQEQIDSRPLEQQLNLVKRIIDVQLENKDIARLLDSKKSSREVQDNFYNKIATDSYVVEIYPDEEGRPNIHTGYYQNRKNESDWAGIVFYDNQLMEINTKPYLPNEVADAIEQLGFSVDRESFCNNKTNKVIDMQEWQNALNMLQVGAAMRINEVKDIDEQKGVKSIEFVARGLDNVSVVLTTKDGLDNRGNQTVEIQSAKVDLTGLESLDKNSVGFQKIYSKVKYALEYFEVEWKNPFDGLEYDNDNSSTDSDDSSTTQSNTRRNR